MAKNKHSKYGCPHTTRFDREVKMRHLPSFSIPQVTNIRGIFQDDENKDTYNEFYESLESSFNGIIDDDDSLTNEEKEQLKNRLAEGKKTFEYFDGVIRDINRKFSKDKPLTKFEDAFIDAYACTVNDFINSQKKKDIVQRAMFDAGVQTGASAEMHIIFKNKIPVEYREEIPSQICALFINVIDKLAALPKFKDYTRTEIIDNYFVQLSGGGIIKGFEGLMMLTRSLLKNKYNELKKLSDANLEKYPNGKKGVYIMSETQQKIFETLLNDPDAWAACVYEAKSLLFDTEKIKIGNKISYVEEVDEDEENNTDPEKDVDSAEESGPEHWMIKADTRSSFNSLSKELRSVFFKLTNKEVGILGFPNIEDAMAIHQTLLEIRYKYGCETSDEFMDIILGLYEEGTLPWGKKLYDEMEKDSYLRSAMFNAHRRNHLNYVHHSKYTKFIETLHQMVTFFYRHKSGRDATVLLGVYKAGITNIDPDNKECIVNQDGVIQVNVQLAIRNELNSFTEGVEKWGVDGIIDLRAWGPNLINEGTPDYEDKIKERKRDFILTVNRRLNLHLTETDITNITLTEESFNKFSKAVYKVYQDITKIGGRVENRTIEEALFKGDSWKTLNLKNLVLSSKFEVTVQQRKSPVEKSHRYNKSTYMIYTVPNSLGDSLERLSKAAKSRESLREYLEKTYLMNPIFATKIGEHDYTIHNAWLKAMWDATDEDLENPGSFVNMLVSKITRGLGTLDTKFEDFTEKDNILFTLNEYFQTMLDTDGEYGVTPLFVTGDSNSTRFLTTPILNEDEVMDGMVDVVLQEFKRMKSFNDFIDFCKRNNLKISEGHQGKTIEEWEKVPEKYRPSIIRKKNSFTFFPSLNIRKDELERLCKEIENLDPLDPNSITKIAQARQKIKAIVNAELSKKYEEFIKTLYSKGIVTTPSVSTAVLNNAVLGISDRKSTSGVLDTNDTNLLWKFYLNSKFHLIQQEQFLTIDPGFYKNTEDMQKRFKETIAAGDTLDLNAVEPINPLRKNEEGYVYEGNKAIDDNGGMQTVVYIDEILTDSDADDEHGGSDKDRQFMKALNDHKIKNSKYNKNTLTDGQAWRSFSSYRKLMIMRGAPYWSDAHEEVYQIIMRNRRAGKTRLEKEDWERILSLGVVFQPLKPFYYGFENVSMGDDNGIMQLPVQIKYSEFPLIPEFQPAGSRLEALGIAMEDANNPIDLVCCTTCVKVGGFGSTDIKDCKTSDDYKAAFGKAYKHALDLRGWRQQSNIPEKVDSTRQVGSQFAKHGYGNLNTEEGPKHYSFLKRIFPNGVMHITKGIKIDVTKGLNLQNLIQMFGALSSWHYIQSSIDLIKKIHNPVEVSAILSELRANDSRGAKDGIGAFAIGENADMELSPAEGFSAADNMASLLSKFRKAVIKRPMKGGSAVQVSAYGFEDVLKVNSKVVSGDTTIIDADCALAFAFSYKYEDGTTVDLSSRYLDYVDPNTGMLLDENGVGVDPEEAVPGEPGKEYYGWNTKLGKEFPGILDLIAYRIPTERAYSIINLKAKRFFPKTAGGIIMVPSQFTTIAGFDFDIDKLFFVRREFVYKRPDINNYDIWTKYYENDPIGKVIKKYLEEANNDAKTGKGLYFGKYDYQYWGTAYEALKSDVEQAIKEGREPIIKDFSKVPKTAEEAFSDFINSSLESNAIIVSKFDENKTFLENSQSAVNNLFFEFMQARLEDPDSFTERYTPGGFQLLEDAKPMMMAIRYASPEKLAEVADAEDPYAAMVELSKSFEDFSPDYDPTEITTIMHYQVANAMYDKCISIAAVQNINQRLTSLVVSMALKKAIRVGSLAEDGVEDASGKDIKKRMINGTDTELVTTNFLASAVDAVKNAVLEFFGINDKTLNIGCLLARIGCTPTDMGLLFNQPVCIRAVEILLEGKGFKSFSNSLEEAMMEIAGSDEYENLKENFYNVLNSEKSPRNSYVRSGKLCKYIGLSKKTSLKSTEKEEYLKGQMAVIHLLKDAQAAAQELAEEVGITQSTSIKSVKSSIGYLQAVFQKAVRFANKFGGEESKFTVQVREPGKEQLIINPYLRITEENKDKVLETCMDSPFCVEQIAFSAIMGFADALGDYFPYMTEGFMFAANAVANLTSRGYMSAEMFDVHNKAFMLYLLEKMTSLFKDDNKVSLANPDGTFTTIEMSKRLFYLVEFPKYFQNILAINEANYKSGATKIRYKDIPILGSISPRDENFNGGGGSKRVLLKMDGIGGLRSSQKDNLIDSWEAMLCSDDPILRDLGVHLLFYSVYSRGFDFGPTTFMSLVPLLLKINLGQGEYAQFFNRVFNLKGSTPGNLKESGGSSDTISLKHYCKAFILNTRGTFYQLTKHLYNSTKNKSNPYQLAKNKLAQTEKASFTIDITNADDKPLLNYLGTIKRNKEDATKIESVSFVPCVEIDGDWYICDTNIESNDNIDFNTIIGESGTITYYRMDAPLGIDYSTPTLYGTREETLADIFKSNQEIGKVVKGIEASYTSTQSQEQDDGNVHGEEIEVSRSIVSPIIVQFNDILHTAVLRLDYEKYKDKFTHLTDIINFLASPRFVDIKDASQLNSENAQLLNKLISAVIDDTDFGHFLNICDTYQYVDIQRSLTHLKKLIAESQHQPKGETEVDGNTVIDNLLSQLTNFRHSIDSMQLNALNDNNNQMFLLGSTIITGMMELLQQLKNKDIDLTFITALETIDSHMNTLVMIDVFKSAGIEALANAISSSLQQIKFSTANTVGIGALAKSSESSREAQELNICTNNEI